MHLNIVASLYIFDLVVVQYPNTQHPIPHNILVLFPEHVEKLDQSTKENPIKCALPNPSSFVVIDTQLPINKQTNNNNNNVFSIKIQSNDKI